MSQSLRAASLVLDRHVWSEKTSFGVPTTGSTAHTAVGSIHDGPCHVRRCGQGSCERGKRYQRTSRGSHNTPLPATYRGPASASLPSHQSYAASAWAWPLCLEPWAPHSPRLCLSCQVSAHNPRPACSHRSPWRASGWCARGTRVARAFLVSAW